MEKIRLWMALFAGSVLLSIMTGCRTGTFASEYGKSDTAYISVVSSSDYAGKNVDVIVDNDTMFQVKVVRSKQSTEKHNGRLYGIGSGKRHVRIEYDGKVIYDKDIFVSSQHTKLIML